MDFLPPPELLQGYARVIGPEATAQLVEDVRRGMAHRWQMQEREQAHDHEQNRKDQRIQMVKVVFAFVLGVIGVGGGEVLVALGHSSAMWLSGASLCAMVLAFLRHQRLAKQRSQ